MHLECPPARTLRVFQDLQPSVLAKLPGLVNAAKQVQREQMKKMPSNPKSTGELTEVLDKYIIAKVGILNQLFCDKKRELYLQLIFKKIEN